ncbi:hypothetical protein WA158_003822 [Blastocystis sp. Blastoise]
MQTLENAFKPVVFNPSLQKQEKKKKRVPMVSTKDYNIDLRFEAVNFHMFNKPEPLKSMVPARIMIQVEEKIDCKRIGEILSNLFLLGGLIVRVDAIHSFEEMLFKGLNIRYDMIFIYYEKIAEETKIIDTNDKRKIVLMNYLFTYFKSIHEATTIVGIGKYILYLFNCL